MAYGFLIRADLLRDLCVSARRSDPRLAQVSERIQRHLVNARVGSWLPGELYLSFHDDVLAIVGESGLYEVARRSVALTAEGPIMSTFLTLARKLSAGRPSALLRWFPGSRSMLARCAGEATYTEQEHGARIDILAIPEPLIGSVGWRIGQAGVLHGIVDLAERAGEVILESSETGSSATFHVHWWARAVTMRRNERPRPAGDR